MDGYFAIAEEELIIGFGYAGVRGKAVKDREEALAAFKATVEGPEASRPKVLLISQLAAASIEDELVDWQMEGEFPLIVEVPSLAGGGEGRPSLIDQIRRAVGIGI